MIPAAAVKPWTDYDWDNWRGWTFRAAAKAAGLRDGPSDRPRRVRPRDLRSSFATLLIYQGQPPQCVAGQLGHSAATLLRDYARVWEDFDPSQRVSTEEQIERVRSRLHGAEPAQGAEHSVLRRARSASRKGRRVPQVFRDDSDESSPPERQNRGLAAVS